MQLLQTLIILAFGYWGYNVFENKNRQGWKGFLWGFFLGLIGVAITYMFSKKEINDTNG
jgi:uncharacterized membrane protein HdeD (DUF308 family)